MTLAIVGVATVLGDFGLSMASIQSQTVTPAQRTNLFWTNSAIGVVLAIVVCAAAPLISLFYGQPVLTGITQVLSLTFVINALSAQFRAEVSRRLRFRWLVGADVGSAAVGLAVATVFAVSGAGLWALVWQQVTIALVTLVILVLGARWLPGRPRRGQEMKSLYQFGANTLGVQLFTYATSNVDSILIGKFWGAGSLGIYDRAYRLFRLPLLQIAAPMTKVAMPILSRLQSDQRYDAYLIRAQLVLGYAFGGTFLLLAGISEPAIDIMLGSGWDAAKPIFAVLALGGVFQGFGYIYYWIFLSRAMTGIQLRWTIIGRSAMVGAMVVGVIWGPLGVAIGSAFGQALNWTLLTIFPIRRTGAPRGALIRVALRPLLFLAPIAVLCFIASYTILASLSAPLSLAILVGMILAYLVVGVTIPMVRNDYRLLWDVAKRMRKQ